MKNTLRTRVPTADIGYPALVLVDPQSGRIVQNPKTVTRSIIRQRLLTFFHDRLGTRSLLDLGMKGREENHKKLVFPQEYLEYKQRNFTPEYQAMVETLAHEALKKIDRSQPPTSYFCIPTRREIHTSIPALLTQKNTSEKSFTLVYHNDINPPAQQTTNDLARLRENPGIFVFDRQVSKAMTLAECRDLTHAVAMEIAFQLGVYDPIIVLTDADVTSESQPGSYGKLVRALRNNNNASLSHGLYLEDPKTIKDNKSYYAKLVAHNIGTQLLDSFLRSDGRLFHPVGCFTAVRASALAYIDGMPSIQFGSDRILADKLFRHRGEKKDIAVFVPFHTSGVYVDGSRSAAYHKTGTNRYEDFAKASNTMRYTRPIPLNENEFVQIVREEVADFIDGLRSYIYLDFITDTTSLLEGFSKSIKTMTHNLGFSDHAAEEALRELRESMPWLQRKRNNE